MRRILRREGQEYEILEWHKCQPEDTCIENFSPGSARIFLRSFSQDHFNLMALRDILGRVSPQPCLARINPDEILEQVTGLLASGRLRVRRIVQKRYVVAKPVSEPIASAVDEPRRKPPPVAPPVEPQKTWIEVLLRDEDEQPVADVRYRITDDYGALLVEGSTTDDGLVRVDGIDPGMYYIGFPDLDRGLWKKQRAPREPVAAVPPKTETDWIEVKLVDQAEQPIADKRFQITGPDGTVVGEGTTDTDGLARIDGITAGTYNIKFPDLDTALVQ